VLKKAQETTEAAATNDSDLPAPEPLDMSKFALKVYNRFTRDVEGWRSSSGSLPTWTAVYVYSKERQVCDDQFLLGQDKRPEGSKQLT
jgi:hypothetical protein